MKEIMTRDGSFTFHNSAADEYYHSITVGALEEAFVKYADQLDLKDGIKVLDFCFGLGYNTLALISRLESCHVIAIEKDVSILRKALEIDVPKDKEKYEIVKRSIMSGLEGEVYDDGRYRIELLIGDGIEIAKTLQASFDGVMFDPFSPKKSPELWTFEVFELMHRLMKKKARLVTYSCARIVRDNMKKAGFEVKDGPVIGRRGPSTIAKR